MEVLDDGIYEWHERAFISDAARYQRSGPPPLTGLFDSLPSKHIAALLVTPPLYDPIHCGLSYGVWAEFPESQRDSD